MPTASQAAAMVARISALRLGGAPSSKARASVCRIAAFSSHSRRWPGVIIAAMEEQRTRCDTESQARSRNSLPDCRQASSWKCQAASRHSATRLAWAAARMRLQLGQLAARP